MQAIYDVEIDNFSRIMTKIRISQEPKERFR